MQRRTGIRKPALRARMAGKALGVLTLAGFGALAYAETQTSWLQSELLSSLARELTYQVADGPSSAIAFPKAGPFDQRLGYVDLPRFVERLEARDFAIARQAQLSGRHLAFLDKGGFAIYPEKPQAGLRLLDQRGEALVDDRYPRYVYGSFGAIPPLVVGTLLYIENRELLDAQHPTRNPAVEWDRLLRVLPGALAQVVDPSIKVAGGSTLATQIEKFRHANEGRTEGARDKLRQMISASVRAYRDGPDTSEARRRLVVDYLNATPLSAQHGYGEVLGLGDGLHAWYGTDFDEANRILGTPPADEIELLRQARIYKQALSLLIAQRRPSYYLQPAGREALARLTDRYLGLLAAENVIPQELADAALPVSLDILPAGPAQPRPSFVDEKAANAIRAELLATLGVAGTYQLDRFDLEVQTTLDRATQQRVSDVLRSLADPKVTRELGLVGHRLLGAGDASNELVLSLTVYERGDGANLVRVQADNLDRPFDVNRGAKLDLGSTAKLRTLITYLEVVAELHGKLASMPGEELARLARAGGDPLTLWAADQLRRNPGQSLEALLRAAMERRYSASPWESFFTGGGVHRFENFDKDDNGRIVTVAQAFRNSINLPFIRMMRDLVSYHRALRNGDAGDILEDARHPARQAYLERSAEREAKEFLNRYYDEFAQLDPAAAATKLAGQLGRSAKRLAVVFRSVRPEASLAEFAAVLREHLGASTPDPRTIEKLYDAYPRDRFSLSDRAYLARLHPLKLWLVTYLQEHPMPSRADVIEASAEARRESYAWLFKTRNKRAQDRRIRILLEEDAFQQIHASWRRQGYPFGALVPSFATAIGSSADRPDALAELMGIILNDGLRQPTARIERLHFAAGTPFETEIAFEPAPAQQVLAPEIAAIVREALADVVANGTARRLHQAFMSDAGGAYVIGAKTGTGDHRRKHFARGGHLIGSTVVSRSATVVFYVGDRFFGTMTIFVSGPAAGEFTFTSSLPAQLLKGLAPALDPLFNGRSAPQTADAAARAES